MQDFWELVRRHAEQVAAGAAPPFMAWAVTTGDAATQETVEGLTTNQVTVWLNGAAQTAENKVTVVLPYGESAPAAGQLWLALLPNYAPPGVLLKRIS